MSNIYQLFDRHGHELSESESDKIEALVEVIDDMKEKDKGFARSLIHQYEQKGRLSEKQWYWVDKLRNNPKGKSERRTESQDDITRPIEVGSMHRLYEAFREAEDKGIKKPKIHWVNEQGESVKFFWSPRFQQIGISVNDHYEAVVNEAGRVTPMKHGSLDKGWNHFYMQKLLGPLQGSLVDSLEAIGRRTGICCLCGRTLTNHESIERGIGPICADNWGF